MKELTYGQRLEMLFRPNNGQGYREISNIECFLSVAFDIYKVFEKQEAWKICH